MPQAEPQNTANVSELQMRGYVIDEAADLALRDVAAGLAAIAMLIEERTDDVPDIPKAEWAGLFRTFSRQALAVSDQAAFANSATARPRNVH